MNILILEDDAERISIFIDKLSANHSLTYVDTAQAAIDLLKTETYNVVFLDHDLGGNTYVNTADKNTGSEVVRWMMKDDYKDCPTVIVHSLNLPAAIGMEKDLAYTGFAVYRIPFTQLVSSYLDDPTFIS